MPGEELDYLCVDAFLDGVVGAQALATAFELGLIDALAQGRAAPPESLAAALGLDAKGLLLLLDLLKAHDVVEKKGGDINRFMQFVLERGADRVRLLLPRFVGRSIRPDGVPFGAGQERALFSHVSPQYRDYIYVHTPGTPLGEQNVCTAKNVF